MSNKYNKRFFTCDDDLLEDFDEEIKNDKRFKNRSETLRYLMRRYVEERQQLRKCAKND